MISFLSRMNPCPNPRAHASMESSGGRERTETENKPPSPPCFASRAIDKDGNGLLSHEEITEALTEFGLTAAQISDIIQEVDADGNGEIDYDEFLTMMRGSTIGIAAQSKVATGAATDVTENLARRRGIIGATSEPESARASEAGGRGSATARLQTAGVA